MLIIILMTTNYKIFEDEIIRNTLPVVTVVIFPPGFRNPATECSFEILYGTPHKISR